MNKMGFFSGLDESNRNTQKEKIKMFLFEGETIEYVYPLSTDFVALTNRRLIFVDKNVLLKETGIVTIPYAKIEQIGIVKDKAWAITDKIEITTRHDKHELKLLKDGLEFYNKLAAHIC